MQSFVLPEKFSIDYRKATFFTQIYAGEITREEALRELLNKPYDPIKAEEEKEYVCKKLGLSISEFERIMSLPPKTYQNYPNDYKKLELIYNIYRKMN